jgi:putative oxidoreductase
MMSDLARLILRLTVGTLLAGHGAQKLFGWFGGPGLKGTHGFMEALGMKPGQVWGTMAAVSEFGGGVFTALGFLNPLGPFMAAGTMAVAIRRAHWGKPIWNMQGGAEFPLTNMAVAASLAMSGPGRYSLDRLFGLRVPRWMATLMFLGGTASTYAALQRPEVAETVIQKASSVLPGTFMPTGDPTIEREERPAATEGAQTQEQPQQASAQ